VLGRVGLVEDGGDVLSVLAAMSSWFCCLVGRAAFRRSAVGGRRSAAGRARSQRRRRPRNNAARCSLSLSLSLSHLLAHLQQGVRDARDVLEDVRHRRGLVRGQARARVCRDGQCAETAGSCCYWSEERRRELVLMIVVMRVAMGYAIEGPCGAM